MTVPQSKDQWSGMTMLNCKSWDIRSAFLRRFGGQAGTPLYTGPTTRSGDITFGRRRARLNGNVN